MRTDGQTDRHDEAYRCCSKFCERAQQWDSNAFTFHFMTQYRYNLRLCLQAIPLTLSKNVQVQVRSYKQVNPTRAHKTHQRNSKRNTRLYILLRHLCF
jgi:hypothetical protein